MDWKAAPGEQGATAMGTDMAAERGAGRAVGLTAVVAAVLGAVIWWATGQGARPSEPAAAVAVVEPVPTIPATAPVPEAVPVPELAPVPPRFDVVRVDAAGLATIAGTAPPDATVSLRLDGGEIATAEADGAGQFAALVTLPPSDVPRLMGLVAVLADGTEVAGVETVAIGPVAAPALAAVDAPVLEAAAPPALLVSEAGAMVLQPPAVTEAPQVGAGPSVSIDAISYGAAGEVLLSGRAAPGAALRLYLDDAPVADVVVGGDGRWQASLAEVAPGLHSLRADALDAGGKVLARFETPFKRDVPVVAPPVVPEVSAMDPAPVAAPAPITITVQPGLTLWAIARENFGDGVMYVQVFEANRDKIKDPDLIYPGQVFTVPKP